MLSIFPDLLTYHLLAPFIIRLMLGFIFVNAGYIKLWSGHKEKIDFFNKAGLRPGVFYAWFIGALEFIGGIFLIVGFLTQPVALAFSLILAGAVIIKTRNPELLPESRALYVILTLISLSLLFSGAGFFAIDYSL